MKLDPLGCFREYLRILWESLCELLTPHFAGCLLTFSGLMLSSAEFHGQAIPLGRPILFVHGWCGDGTEWQPLRDYVTNQLTHNFPTLYPNAPTPQVNYYVYYDQGADSVFFEDANGQIYVGSHIPSTNRIFSIKFRDPVGQTFDTADVARISILNKAYELSRVIKEISAVTTIKDVIVVTHSMGGLVARSYLENIASQQACYYYGSNPLWDPSTPNYLNGVCRPGQSPANYTSDIADIITLNTPHGGTVTANASLGFPQCWLGGGVSASKSEMEPHSQLLQALNYYAGLDYLGDSGTVTQSASLVASPIQSIESYLGDVPYPWTDGSGFVHECDPPENIGSGTYYCDDIISAGHQAIRQNIEPSHLPAISGLVTDVGNSLSTFDPNIALNADCYAGGSIAPLGRILHFGRCLGDQAQTKSTVYTAITPLVNGQTTSVTVQVTCDSNICPGSYSFDLQGPPNAASYPHQTSNVTFLGVGLGQWSVVNVYPPSAQYTAPLLQPQTIGWDSVSLSNTWAVTFNLNFTTTTSMPPSANTTAASGLAGDGATLNGNATPNGASTSAWFEYGTSNALGSFNSTASQPLGSGTTAQSFSYALSDLTSNTTYYYRAVASNTAGMARSQSILSFTTLSTLPKPVLLSPANGVLGLSTTPAFTWTVVANATSYRLMVATNPADLPTDPTSAVCGLSCVLDVTPSAVSYTPAAGTLGSGTLYYWQVHARSVLQYGDWSAVSTFTTVAVTGNDFGLQANPSSQSVSQSGSAGYGIGSTTTSGVPQQIIFGIGNLPSGITASFSPQSVTSGSSANLTLSASTSAPTGTYTIVILGTGTTASHSVQVSLAVTTFAGGPVVSITPTSQIFPDQMVGTVGNPQTLMFMNTGGGQLIVNSISLAAGSDFIITQQPTLPLILNPLVPATLQVAFAPSVSGPRSGQILLWDNAPTSPQLASLSGNGLVAPPTNGTIQVNATLNGSPVSNSSPFSYVLSGPSTYTAGGDFTFSVAPGTYALSFAGNPGYLTLSGITPSTTQTVAAGGVITFTMNFTAPDDFGVPVFGPSLQVVTVGGIATSSVLASVPPNSVPSPITLGLTGLPPGATYSIIPQPMMSGSPSTLTVSTSSATPPGAYVISAIGTNAEGLTHSGGNTLAIIVNTPPSQAPEVDSLSTGGTAGNGASATYNYGDLSADGRYVAFESSATNLVNGVSPPAIFVRDRVLGQTKLISASSTGVPANADSHYPSISADGRFVAFHSDADNLVAGATLGVNAVYVRDQQLGVTERDDVASDGTPANQGGFIAAISASGRFVVFESTSTNLVTDVTGLTGTQIYEHDRETNTTILVSIGNDGNAANRSCQYPVISADGRFVAFDSAATNLDPAAVNGVANVFVRDLQANQTFVVSLASTGILSDKPTMSADGRFVGFISSATDLVPGISDGEPHLYIRDRMAQQTTVADVDANGLPLSDDHGGSSARYASLSADGRFITFSEFGQIFLRDNQADLVEAVSVASDGSSANAFTFYPTVAGGGSVVTFPSSATNLIPNDTNGVADTFVVGNPYRATPFLSSVVLSPLSTSGGSAVTGTVTLSGPAPAGGATVVVSSDNSAAQIPPLVLVPSGTASGTFSFNTSPVATETIMTVIGSYNGASAVALLTLEPAPALTIVPSSGDFGGQPVGSTSGALVFAISNTGTASLSLNSESMASARLFKIVANTCSTTLAAGGSCAVSIAFTPTTTGSTSDTLQISYTSGANVQSVPVSGTGTAPLVSLAPAIANFGSHTIPSATPVVVTLTNVGTAPLTGISSSISGPNTTDFSVSSDGCSGTILQPSSGCLITVVFSPKAAGLRSASLSVNDNATVSPQTVGLSGTGGTPMTVSPAALSYGNQGLSSTTAAKKVTLTNNTGAVVTISSTVISGTSAGDFSQSATTCGPTLGLKKSCTVSVTFTPAALGARSATLTLTDSAVNSPQTVAFSGMGVLQVTLSAATFAFGNQADGSTSAAKTVTLSNNTSAALAILSAALTGANAGEFAASANACGSSVGAHSSCKMSVTFTPVTPGSKMAALTITDSANNSPQSVGLTGTGIVPVSLAPSRLIFAAQKVGTTSSAKIVTVKNNLKATLTISSITLTGANASDFAQSANTCGTTLAPSASCTVSITFKPAAKGSRAAVLNLADNAITSPQIVSLSGTGE